MLTHVSRARYVSMVVPRYLIQRLIPFALLVLTLVLVPLRLLEPEGVPRYLALKRELRLAQTKTAELKENVRTLEQRIDSLAHDPAVIEQIIREELGFVRQDEIVFQFSD